MSLSTLTTDASKNWVCTQLEVNQVRCEWTLRTSALSSKKKGEAIFSPSFYTGNGDQRWSLQIFPRGEDEKCNDKVSCFLNLVSSKKLGIYAEYKISIWKLDELIIEEELAHEFDELQGWGISELVEQSKLLNPHCSHLKIIFHLDTDTEMPTKQWSGNFRLLFKDPKFSDITIIVGENKFPAHKSILSVQSSVFAAMFNHVEMEENRTKEVKIEDMEPAVVEGMLEYIYTGQVANLEGLVAGLLVAAEKYDLRVLKAACENIFRKNLNVNNAAETLMLANIFHASKLKESAIEFIRDNLSEVAETNGFKEITDHALLKEIILFDV